MNIEKYKTDQHCGWDDEKDKKGVGVSNGSIKELVDEMIRKHGAPILLNISVGQEKVCDNFYLDKQCLAEILGILDYGIIGGRGHVMSEVIKERLKQSMEMVNLERELGDSPPMDSF